MYLFAVDHAGFGQGGAGVPKGPRRRRYLYSVDRALFGGGAVQAYQGVPVDAAFLYSADRVGMSVFGLRTGTGNLWREYRFQFNRELTGLQDFHGCN